jgi:hypothetical protein
MTIAEFRIPLQRVSIWSQDQVDDAPDQSDYLDISSGIPDLGFIDPLIRRRLSRMARGMLHCAGRLSPGSGDQRTVFASRHGEVSRTIPVLEDLARGMEPSPTLFSMNVHNAVAGVWSIVKKNRAPSTSLAAGPETFGWGLLDAFAAVLADPAAPVLYAFGDDCLPDIYTNFDTPGSALHAISVLIGTPARHHLVLTWKSSDREDLEPQSLRFIHALSGGPSQLPWSSHGRSWNWHVD